MFTFRPGAGSTRDTENISRRGGGAVRRRGTAGKWTVVEGTIAGYECGDNCYLTIRDARRKEHVGLCTAVIRESWNEATELPGRFWGRKVRVNCHQGACGWAATRVR